jgi:hypothetical protein
MVVLPFVDTTLSALPKSVISTFSSFIDRSLEMILAQVKIAISFN